MNEQTSPVNPIPVSSKFAIATELAKMLEALNAPTLWNFPDAVTLEIHEPLLRQIDCGSGAELLNQFVGVGGEIIDYDFNAEPKTWAELSQLLTEAYKR